MQADLGFWVLQGLNALQLSMLLFLLSVGLTVIFGLMALSRASAVILKPVAIEVSTNTGVPPARSTMSG